MASTPLVEEGLETPIDNFVFRQCPAEFKLKATNAKDENPSWAVVSSASRAPKASLVQVSHKNGIILFPHFEKGALGYAPINNLAEKDNLSHEFLSFPGDESFIQAFCLDASEKIIYVAKGSNIIYPVDLTSDDKRPSIKKKVQLGSSIVECVVSTKHELFVLLETGKILNLATNEEEFLMEIDLDISSIIKSKFSCMSQIRNDTMAVGSKTESEIYLINLGRDEITFKTIAVPWESLACGSGVISSIFLFEDENTLLFSCVPDDPETDDVPLLLLENISNGKGMKFSFFFDPCASRPPRLNQFYFQTLPISKWAENLVDSVVVGNFASPDLGVCGRLQEGGEFQTFYIDNDEGLAQLPFVNGEVTYPLGLALDLSSKTPLDNLKDPEGEKYPSSPIVWVLTDTAQLCPFYLVKTDETKPFPFMISVPNVQFSSAPSSVEEISSEDLESFSSEEEDEVSDVAQSKTPPQKAPIAGIAATSTPQTPSKVPLQQLASLQKSSEIKPADKTETSGLFSFKPAPLKSTSETSEVSKPPTEPVAVSKPSTTAKPTVQIAAEPAEPVLVKKIEAMETMNVSAYQNILLAEIAATHAAMQEDIFSLKQLSLKNSLLLRQNSQKYFNSLGALETYAVSLEKLLGSSDKVFLGVKDRLEDLKIDLNELQVKMKNVKSTWSRIKQDNKINWDSRAKALSVASQELFERIDRLRSFMSNPTEASKYRATLKSFVDSTQEKVQLLMAHLSNLFVCQNEDVYADLQGLTLSPSLSSESLLEQMNVLSLKSSRDGFESDSRLKNEKRNKSLLNAVKARGARLLIPAKFTPAPIAVAKVDEKHLKLTAEDESLISSFISAIKLTDNVPEFAETAVLAKLSLEDKDPVDTKPAVKVSEAKPAVKVSEAKPATHVSSAKPFEFKSASATESKPFDVKAAAVESKPIDFKLPETTKPSEPESKPFEFKPVSESSPATSTFSFSSVTSEKSSTSPEFGFKPLESKSTSETSTSPSISTISSKTESSVATESSVKETPKMPSIFSMASQPAAAEHESILKKESPLPTFDLLNFGSTVKEEKEEKEKSENKPFPAIFGVKPTTDEPIISELVKSDSDSSSEIATYENIKAESVKAESAESNKSESTSFFSFSSPSISAKSEEKKEEAAVPAQGFSFNFKSEASKDPVKEPEPVKETATPPTTAAPEFSFSFAPNVEKSPAQPSSTANGFSITTKPTFGAPSSSAPVFGSTSTPAAPVFGSTSMPTAQSAPAFGQTSFPSFGFSASAPVPAAPSGSSGFAAFAAASNQGSTGFSAFAAPQGNNGNGLTFASFLPADKDKKQQSENDGKGSAPASSTFSFTGFRE